MDPDRTSLSFAVFDIRPFTGEICKKGEDAKGDVLKIIQLALKTDRPLLAWEMLKTMDLETRDVDLKWAREILQFIEHPLCHTVDEAAFKIKLALQLRRYLKRNKRLEPRMKKALNQQLLALGQELFSKSNKVFHKLQLSKAEH